MQTRLLSLALAAGLATPALALDDARRIIAEDGSPAIDRTVWLAPRPITAHAGRPGTRGEHPTLEFLATGPEPEADQPVEVAYLADGSGAVIVHRDTDNVTFFDTATRTITDTVAVGDLPTDVAVSPDGRYVVVPNALDHSVSVISVATRQVVATIPVSGLQPYSVEVSADSQLAVVGLINDGAFSAYSIIDLNTLAEVRTIDTTGQGVIGFYFSPENAIAGELFSSWSLSPDGRTILLPDRTTSFVNVYDAGTGALVQAIDTGVLHPAFADVSADADTAIVGHESPSQSITEIDLDTYAVTGSFPLPERLSERVIRITPDKSHAIAAVSNNVIFVDLATGAETTRLFTGVVGDIEISHDGAFAFVSNFNARVIDIATRTLVGTVPFAACTNAAVSPVTLEAVALNNRFRENIHLYSINGASASLLGWSPTGEAPEADAARDLAISADGRTVLVANNISANATILDLATDTVRATVPTGDRPLAAAITPDGAYAVVCNADEPAGNLRGTVSIVDLSTDTVVKTLVTHDRPSAVRISPDGQTAYVLTIAGSDAIYFIDIDGAASSILGTVPAGQAGSWQGVTYSAISGIELSADGSLLAVCDSFNDLLNLFDTATRTQVASVPVGDFPINVAFNAAGTRAYVANAFSHDLSVVEINGGSSASIATVPTGQYPYALAVDAAGAYVYIGNNDQNAPGIRVLDTATNSIVTSVSLAGDRARTMHLGSDSILYVGTSGAEGGDFLRITAAGAASAVIDSTPLSGVPSSMVFSEPLGKAVLAQPGAIPDGVDIVSLGTPACPADFDNSGDLTLADFVAFRNAYVAGDLAADFDNSGTLTLADFVAFRNAYVAGCP